MNKQIQFKKNKIQAPEEEQLLFIQNQNTILIQKLEEYLTELTNSHKIVEQQNEKIEQQKDILQQQQETIDQCKKIIQTLKKEKQRVAIQIENCKRLEYQVKDDLDTIQQLSQKINEQSVNKMDLLEVIEQLKSKLQKLSNQQIILIAEIQDKNTQIRQQETYFNASIQTNQQLIIDQNKIIKKLEIQLQEKSNCPSCQKLQKLVTQLQDQLKLQDYQMQFKIKQKYKLRINELELNYNSSELQVHTAAVRQAIISQDGSIIVSGSFDQTIKVWNIYSKQEIKKIKHRYSVYSIALSSNNEYLAFSDTNYTIYLYNLKYDILGDVKIFKNMIESIIFSQDNQYLLFGGENNELIIWSLINKIEIDIFISYSSIRMIVISPDNRIISCICNKQGQINIWDFETRTKIIEQIACHRQVNSFCQSSDSSIFVTSGTEGLIKLWKLEQLPKQRWSFTQINEINAATSLINQVKLSLDQKYIISICNQEGNIMIHEKESGELVQILFSQDRSNDFASLSISNDMNTLVSTNFTDIIRVWTRE